MGCSRRSVEKGFFGFAFAATSLTIPLLCFGAQQDSESICSVVEASHAVFERGLIAGPTWNADGRQSSRQQLEARGQPMWVRAYGGDLGARVRFVGQNGGPRTFDTPWDMPLDVWSNSEKPEEDKPQGWVSVKEMPGNPQSYTLEQNFPNPFNPSTKIRFSIPEQGLVTLKVFNLLGEEVATLINTEMTTGSYEVDFKGTEISSGIYFYTLTADNFISTKKMILLK